MLSYCKVLGDGHLELSLVIGCSDYSLFLAFETEGISLSVNNIYKQEKNVTDVQMNQQMLLWCFHSDRRRRLDFDGYSLSDLQRVRGIIELI